MVARTKGGIAATSSAADEATPLPSGTPDEIIIGRN
jgi:hypothetical protein